MTFDVPKSHPRYLSLVSRHAIIEGNKKNIVADAGIISHGRGEAFDYLFDEKTHKFAKEAIKAAVAKIIVAKNPIISVNGNVAALCPKSLVDFSLLSGAKLEINLFYRTKEREDAITKVLKDNGATEILGVGDRALKTIDELEHARRIVDAEGIYVADVVFVPLEDGDRTEALKKMGKDVITVDLNPLSRTAQKGDITIVDNICRAMELMIEEYKILIKLDKKKLEKIITKYDNKKILKESLKYISRRFK